MGLEEKMDMIFREVCNLDGNITIDDSMSSSTVVEWDSLANMQLIVELEEGFNIEFDFEELLNIEKWGDFKTAVRNKIS